MDDISVPHYLFGKGGLGIHAYVDIEGKNVVCIAPLREIGVIVSTDDLTDEIAYMEDAIVLVFPTWDHASRVYDALVYTAEAEDGNG